ncbi:dbo [Symbiodinium sp. CCMP2592]|nr:dbo [Symbiodinium sp. CCMP2592]
MPTMPSVFAWLSLTSFWAGAPAWKVTSGSCDVVDGCITTTNDSCELRLEFGSRHIEAVASHSEGGKLRLRDAQHSDHMRPEGEVLQNPEAGWKLCLREREAGRSLQAAKRRLSANEWRPLSGGGTIPEPRSIQQCGSAVWSTAHNGLYMFAGLDGSGRFKDLHFYDPEANAWQELASIGLTDADGCRATSNEADEIYAVCWHSDLHVYSRQANAWQALSPSGDRPVKNSNQGMAWSKADGGLYIISGTAWGVLENVHFYSPQANNWQHLAPTGTAPECCGFQGGWSEAAYGFYGLGGWRPGGHLGDLFFYSRQANEWQLVTAAGAAPSARVDHGAVWAETPDGLYVFGGENYAGKHNDLYLYSRQVNRWYQLSPSGEGPDQGRFHGVAWADSIESLYVFGGENRFSNWMNDLHVLTPKVSCEAGLYIADDGSCEPCPVGTFTKIPNTCYECSSDFPGSTTQGVGSTDAGMCIRPQDGQDLQCTSGIPCSVTISGYNLQDGHRVALTESDSCQGALRTVPNLPNEGASGDASQGVYTWGSSGSDFAPEGGSYQVCWCANINGIVCDSLQLFQMAVGRLQVRGPSSAHSFWCVRGRDCTDLQPLDGVGLSSSDQVVLRSAGCGSVAFQQISPSNLNGIASLTPGSPGTSSLVLSFGESNLQQGVDLRISANANEAGHDLCWCGRDSCNAEDFSVPFGKLRVQGPLANQEISCSVGQRCSLGAVQSVRASLEDRIMILAGCGTGQAVPGFPGGGIAKAVDDGGFELLGTDGEVLQPRVGIYRLCFCREGSEIGACSEPAAFAAPVGLLTVNGPFSQMNTCVLGSTCTLQLSGTGLAVNDKLALTKQSGCDALVGDFVSLQGYSTPKEPIRLRREGDVWHADVGKIPSRAVPGTYKICWCPAEASCEALTSFRAEAGTLQLECPRGFFLMAGRCMACGRGFYCGGGELATRVHCPDRQTTISRHSSERSECVCSHGFFDFSGSCTPCSKGTYKSEAGNFECSACPSGTDTHLEGSVSNSSCSQANVSSELQFENQSEIPTVTFSLLLSSSSSLDHLTMSTLRRSISESTNIDPDNVVLLAQPRARRLSTERVSQTVGVVLKHLSWALATLSAQELDPDMMDVVLDDARARLSNLGVDVNSTEAGPEVSPFTVACSPNAAVPPGVVLLTESGCECKPGFRYDPTVQACFPCPKGFYKSDLANTECAPCDEGRSTSASGAVSSEECTCQSGLFEQGGSCNLCPMGSFCDGSGTAARCPDHSTTESMGSRTNASCLCDAGYQREESGCVPCPRSFYKESQSNALCSQRCPVNADSYAASTSQSSCFCKPGHHAWLTGDQTLQQCMSCAAYGGLTCPGEWDEDGKHAQPRAIPGYFMTGQTSAVRCMVFLSQNESVCRGGSDRCREEPESPQCQHSNECEEGSTGWLCGECAEGKARWAYLRPCQDCMSQSSMWLALAIAADTGRIALLNFAMAAFSARSAGKVSFNLHSPMIRMLLRFKDACSVLTDFDLDRLHPFSWSVRAADADADQACSGASCRLLSFPWPTEATQALETLLSLISIMPKVNVEFAAACEAQSWYKGNKGMQRLVPSLYYLFLPILTLVGTLLVCAVAVYVVVPVGNRLGVEFNDCARERAKRKNLAQCAVSNVEEANADPGSDLSSCVSEISSGFIVQADWEAPWEVLTEGIALPTLKNAADGEVALPALRRMVLGAAAWKLRGQFKAFVDRESMPLEEMATAVALKAADCMQLKGMLEKGGGICDDFLHQACEQLRRKAASDASKLNFGLFSPYASLKQLLKQSAPAIWLTQLSLWPELLSKFLQMIRCSPMQEERDGQQDYVARLLPFPDVECWSPDHTPFIAVAAMGLLLWCLGLPLLLFLRIWMLPDRHDPANYRLYGFFIQGLSPRYWYWDLIVKRADIGLMVLTAYTSFADDDNAKLLLFPVLSGMQLGLSTWVRPYANSQSQSLDVLESVLLASRFILFSAIAVLLIFFPAAELVWIWAVLLLTMIFFTIAYSSMHILAQFLRGAASEMEVAAAGSRDKDAIRVNVSETSHERMESVGFLRKLKQKVVELLIPVFQPAKRLVYSWSVRWECPKEHTRSSELVHRSWTLMQMSRVSGKILRFDVSIQRQDINNAYREFLTFWWGHCHGKTIPNFIVFSALAATYRALPLGVTNSMLQALWISELGVLSAKTEQVWRLYADDFTNALTLFGALSKQAAIELVNSASSIFRQSVGGLSSRTEQDHAEASFRVSASLDDAGNENPELPLLGQASTEANPEETHIDLRDVSVLVSRTPSSPGVEHASDSHRDGDQAAPPDSKSPLPAPGPSGAAAPSQVPEVQALPQIQVKPAKSRRFNFKTKTTDTE